LYFYALKYEYYVNMENYDENYWFDKGNEFYNSGNFEEAIKCYAEATRIIPDDAAAFYNWGTALSNLAKLKQDEALFRESFTKYAEATRIIPDDAAAFYNWGTALYDLAKLKQDEALFRESFVKYTEATRINPDYAAAFINWGNALSDLAELKQDEALFRESFVKYTEATRIISDDADAFNNWGTALSNLAKLKQDETLFRESFIKYTEATRINPDDAVAFNNWGLALYDLAKLKQDEALFRESINKFSRAIKINSELAVAYYNRGLSYGYLNKFANKFSDMNTYLYWSIKQGKIEKIQTLLNTFEEHPQTIITIYEEFDVNKTPHLFDYCKSAESKISDFKELIDYYESCSDMDERELLSAKAILYYYLGGYVAAFMIFDDQLDVEYDRLTSQEFFYYVKTAFDIKIDAQSILRDALSRIEESEKNSKDYYYLGHLYLLAENREKAKHCFEQSMNFDSDFIFSKIMLLFLGEKGISGKNIVNNLQSLNLRGEIDYNTKDLSQFQDFFHVSECQEAISKLAILPETYEPIIWKAFNLSDVAKVRIDEQQRIFSAKILKTGVLDKWEYQMKNSTQNEKSEKKNVLLKYIKITRKYENNNDDEVNDIFEGIKKDATLEDENGKNLSSYEEVMFLCIKNQTLDVKDYLSFILYYLLDTKISEEETFYLLFYLKYKMKDKFYQDNKKLIEQGVGILPNIGKFLSSIKIGISFYRNINEENKNYTLSFNAYQSNADEYIQFKENCWKQILVEYNTLRDEKFEKQYELHIIENEKSPNP